VFHSANAPSRGPGRNRRQGFILTLTLILVISVVVIGSVVGLAALRNALFIKSGENVILDDAGIPFGRAKVFDLCEAPLLVCKDPDNGLVPIVGVRPTRFTSRNAVYYADADCDPAGGVFLAPPGVPLLLVGVWQPELPVGYLNGSLLDDGVERVAYGVGGPEPGLLYRSDDATPTEETISSVWPSLAPDCAPDDLPGAGAPPAALCENIGPLDLWVVPAVEVEIMAGTNVLEQFTAPFSIPASAIAYTAAAPEGAVLQAPTIFVPGSPTVFPGPTAEDAAPLPENAPGVAGPGDPVTQPAPGPEEDPP